MSTSDLAVVTVAVSEFEASAKVAVLEDHDIRATVSRNAPSWTGQMSISPTARGASVLVRRDDLERARAILEANAQDSVDLDWDEVDVGEREDDLPLTEPGRMPAAARFALVVAIGLIAVALLPVLIAWVMGLG